MILCFVERLPTHAIHQHLTKKSITRPMMLDTNNVHCNTAHYDVVLARMSGENVSNFLIIFNKEYVYKILCGFLLTVSSWYMIDWTILLSILSTFIAIDKLLKKRKRSSTVALIHYTFWLKIKIKLRYEYLNGLYWMIVVQLMHPDEFRSVFMPWVLLLWQSMVSAKIR